jgi:hypothetical protein
MVTDQRLLMRLIASIHLMCKPRVATFCLKLLVRFCQYYEVSRGQDVPELAFFLDVIFIL